MILIFPVACLGAAFAGTAKACGSNGGASGGTALRYFGIKSSTQFDSTLPAISSYLAPLSLESNRSRKTLLSHST